MYFEPLLYTLANWRKKLYTIIFESDTRAGKLFDIVLIWIILLSLIIVMLESVSTIKQEYGKILWVIEWIITIIFSIEYFGRIISYPSPRKYIVSFWGIIDLLAVLPTYLSLFITGSHYFIVIRALRLLRIFRILKLAHFLSEAEILSKALKASTQKITVFLGTVLSLVTILGTMMYLIEGPENGFTSIPISIYWAIVTLTTVGYGDITPLTVVGKALASFIMILGYSIIAVPTGIVTVSLTEAVKNQDKKKRICPRCKADSHQADASFCRVCGEQLK